MPLPTPGKGESDDDFVSRFMSNEEAKKEFPDREQRLGVAFSKLRDAGRKVPKPKGNPGHTPKEKKKRKSELKESESFGGLKFKEGVEDIVTGLVATTHPDRVYDILSEYSLGQVIDGVNDTSSSGGQRGAPRDVSMFHDWIKEDDTSKDVPAWLLPTARMVDLPDGHKGVEVDAKLNKFYDGPMTPEEVKYRIENGGISGFSIEFATDADHSTEVVHNGQTYRFIKELTEFAGVGFARPRKIANPQAVIYKEIESKAKEGTPMSEEKENKENKEPAVKEKNPPAGDNKQSAAPAQPEKKETEENPEKKPEVKETKKEDKKLSVKEMLESKEFIEAVQKELEVKSKITKEEETVEQQLSVKEMNEGLKSKDFKPLQYKEAASRYFQETEELYGKQFLQGGIPLNTTLQVKCHGTKMVINGQLETKATLDTTTNTTALTLSIVEFADVFLPGIIETFNQQINLWNELSKRDHIMGGNFYGWRVKADQASSLSVDPDDPTVVKQPISKVKLRTDIKEYRIGISVVDYVLHHSRAAIGDLFMIEAEGRARDLMKDINGDLFTEQVDTGNQIIGLEAIADSVGNTTLYGLTRSVANRLAPDAAGDTFNAVGGAITTALLRQAARLPEIEGALRSDLRYIMNPNQRDAVFELEDGNIRYPTGVPQLGFDGQFAYDGVPVIVDSDCQSDAIFVVDMVSYYIVISRAPQLNGLAKVGAAEEAYMNVYFAVIYEQPRRIHMLDTLT